MTTRKTKGQGRREASKYLEGLMGGPLTLGAALSGLRQSDEQSLAEFAKLLGVSRSHLCDIEQGRRAVSPERAARFAKALDQSEAQFVRLALQDQIRSAHKTVLIHQLADLNFAKTVVPADDRKRNIDRISRDGSIVI